MKMTTLSREKWMKTNNTSGRPLSVIPMNIQSHILLTTKSRRNRCVGLTEHYRFSSDFLCSYGLKVYDDDDCKKGFIMVEHFPHDDK